MKEMSFILIVIYLLFLAQALIFSRREIGEDRSSTHEDLTISSFCKRRERKVLIIPTIILSALVGFRGDVSGYDYHVYQYFYDLNYGENPYGYEILFVYLRNLFKFLGADYNIFILALGIFFVWGTYYIFVTYSENPSLCFYIYLSTFFFWHNFNILRSFIAIIIFYIALRFILKRELWRYLISSIAAFNFHKTAIIIFPLYFILMKKISLKIMGILTVVALLVNPLSNLVFKLNIELFGLSERIMRYVNIKEMGSTQEFLELAVLMIGIVAVHVTNRKRELELDERENLFYNLTFYSFIFFIIFYRYAIMLRFMEYFRFAGIITAVYLLNRIKEKKVRYLVIFLLVIYLTFRYYNSVFDYNMADYKTWLK